MAPAAQAIRNQEILKTEYSEKEWFHAAMIGMGSLFKNFYCKLNSKKQPIPLVEGGCFFDFLYSCGFAIC